VHLEKPSAPSIASQAPLVSAVAPRLTGEMLLLWDSKLLLGFTGNKLCPRAASSLKRAHVSKYKSSGCSMQSAALQLSPALIEGEKYTCK